MFFLASCSNSSYLLPFPHYTYAAINNKSVLLMAAIVLLRVWRPWGSSGSVQKSRAHLGDHVTAPSDLGDAGVVSCPPSLASGVATSRPWFPSVVLASRCGHVVSAVPSAVLASRVDTSCPPSQCRPGVSASSYHCVRRSRCRRVVVSPSRCVCRR